jgi:halocyanin-like protein
VFARHIKHPRRARPSPAVGVRRHLPEEVAARTVAGFRSDAFSLRSSNRTEPPNIFGRIAEAGGLRRPDTMTTGGPPIDRRTILEATGTAVTGTLLAGCSGGRSRSGDGDGAGADSPDEGGGGTPGTKRFDGWMGDVGNYDGVVDETGSDDVVVKVGAPGNGGAYAYAPAAIEVASGTTVVWEWTGEGDAHDVVDRAGNFRSEMRSERGATFEHAFRSRGTHEYYCTPHRTMGMKGVVVVVD